MRCAALLLQPLSSDALVAFSLGGSYLVFPSSNCLLIARPKRKSQQSILYCWLALGNPSFTLIRSATPKILGAGSLVLFCFNFIWEMPGDSACRVPLLASLFADAGPDWNRMNFATAVWWRRRRRRRRARLLEWADLMAAADEGGELQMRGNCGGDGKRSSASPRSRQHSAWTRVK